MRASAPAFFSAFAVLMLSSCCCPRPPQMYGPPCCATEAGPTAVRQVSSRENPISPNCQDSTPAKAEPTGNLEPQFVLPVIPRCQEGLYSCWSTVTEMVVEFLSGERVSQCQQSDEAFGLGDCCGPNGILIADSACDLASYPEFKKWGDHYESRPFPLDPTEVKNHINQLGLPFAFAWARNPEPSTQTPAGLLVPGESQADQVFHLLLAIGYGIESNTQGVPLAALVIIDSHPFVRSDAVIIPHHEYDGSDGSYTHAEDFVAFPPSP